MVLVTLALFINWALTGVQKIKIQLITIQVSNAFYNAIAKVWVA
jgi:hypothetical protein